MSRRGESQADQFHNLAQRDGGVNFDQFRALTGFVNPSSALRDAQAKFTCLVSDKPKGYHGATWRCSERHDQPPINWPDLEPDSAPDDGGAMVERCGACGDRLGLYVVWLPDRDINVFRCTDHLAGAIAEWRSVEVALHAGA